MAEKDTAPAERADPFADEPALPATRLAVFDDTYCAGPDGMKMQFRREKYMDPTKILNKSSWSSILPRLSERFQHEKYKFKAEMVSVAEAAEEEKMQIVDADGKAVFVAANPFENGKVIADALMFQQKLVIVKPDGTEVARLSSEGCQLELSTALKGLGLKTVDGKEIDLLVTTNALKLEMGYKATIYLGKDTTDGVPIARIVEAADAAIVHGAIGAVGVTAGLVTERTLEPSMDAGMGMLAGIGVGIGVAAATAAASVGIGKACGESAKTEGQKRTVEALTANVLEVQIAPGVDAALVFAVLMAADKMRSFG